MSREQQISVLTALHLQHASKHTSQEAHEHYVPLSMHAVTASRQTHTGARSSPTQDNADRDSSNST
jgi:hypothetical protein